MNTSNPNPTRRSTVLAGVSAALALSGLLALPTAHAGVVEDAVTELQQEWEVINYQVPAGDREKRFEALAAKANRVSQSHPQRAEPLVWEGIIVASWAAAKGGLAALGLVNQAKSLYESAIKIDGNVLDGAAYNSLGVLYYKVPSWPIAFGDKDKAKEMLQRALELNPKGIDPNYFYAEYLVDAGQPAEAIPYLERALEAPDRPGRQLSDTGRREEARALLEKTREQAR